jgi:hypothetical protein
MTVNSVECRPRLCYVYATYGHDMMIGIQWRVDYNNSAMADNQRGKDRQ